MGLFYRFPHPQKRLVYTIPFSWRPDNNEFSEEFSTFVFNSDTGLSMELNRICLKEAIVMWPDMHSFLEFNKFEPISNS